MEGVRRAVGLRPADPVLHNHLGRVLAAAGSLEEAAAEYRTAIAMAPGVPVPYRNLGLVLYRSGDRGAARAALEKAASLDATGEVMEGEAGRILEELRR